MTKEDKELLLKDLCARLPYGVIVESLWTEKLTDVDGYEGKLTTTTIELFIDNEVIVKPYLRPMSSMTEEEIKEFTSITENILVIGKKYTAILGIDSINWLLENHFDFMSLIPKDLAIEVTKDNNPYKN